MKNVWLLGLTGLGLGMALLPRVLKPQLAIQATVNKNIGGSVTTTVTVRNDGTGSGTWTISYDFENDQYGTVIKDPYWTVNLTAGQQTTLTDTRTVQSTTSNGSDPKGKSFRLIVYYGEGSITKPGTLPSYWLTDWYLYIQAPSLSLVSSNVA
jgi:hypothetical protein